MKTRFSVARSCCDPPAAFCDPAFWPLDGDKPDVLNISVTGQGSWNPAVCFGLNDCSAELVFGYQAISGPSSGMCTAVYWQFGTSGCFNVSVLERGVLGVTYPAQPEDPSLGRYQLRMRLEFIERDFRDHQSLDFVHIFTEIDNATLDGLEIGPGELSNPDPRLGGCTDNRALITVP